MILDGKKRKHILSYRLLVLASSTVFRASHCTKLVIQAKHHVRYYEFTMEEGDGSVEISLVSDFENCPSYHTIASYCLGGVRRYHDFPIGGVVDHRRP